MTEELKHTGQWCLSSDGTMGHVEGMVLRRDVYSWAKEVNVERVKVGWMGKAGDTLVGRVGAQVQVVVGAEEGGCGGAEQIGGWSMGEWTRWGNEGRWFHGRRRCREGEGR